MTGKPLPKQLRVFLTVVGCVLAAYAGLAGVACFLLNSRTGSAAVNYFTVITLPFHWEDFRQTRGRQHLKEASRLFGERNWKAAVAHFRAGLSQYPEDCEARLMLAQLYAAGRRLDLAKSTLVEGLPYSAANPAYIRRTLDLLLERQEDTAVIAISREHLRRPELSPESRRVFKLAAATAAYFRGHYDEAEDWLTNEGGTLDTSAETILRARIEWERGYRELAITALAQLLNADAPAPSAYDLLIRYLREERRYAEIRRISVAQQLATPRWVRPRLDYLYACEQLGERDRARWETGALIRDFGTDPSAAAALGEYAVESTDVTLARALSEQPQRGQQTERAAARLALAETLIALRDFQSALQELNRLETAADQKSDAGLALREGLRAAAYAGIGDQAAVQLHLSAFLASSDLRAETIVAVARRLQDAGSSEAAQKALESAIRVDPMNQAALMKLIQLDLTRPNLEHLTSYLRLYVRTRRPSPALLSAARECLSSDQFLFTSRRDSALELLRGTTPLPLPPSGRSS